MTSTARSQTELEEVDREVIDPGPAVSKLNPLTILALGTLTVLFSFAYYVFSMRKQKPTTLAATKLGPVSYDIAHFGAVWFWSNVALDIVLGAMSAFALVLAMRQLRVRRSASAGLTGTAGTFALAFATFGCPTCTLPLAGTLGIGLFASTLPLFGTELKLLAALPLAASLVILSRSNRIAKSSARAAV